ncbi:MAG TPA: hypothetical protein VF493_01685 [Terriglobales bacterium]
MLIDGSCCATLHAQGVRDTYINNFWATQSSTPDQSVLFRSAVQVFWHGGEIAPAGYGSNAGLTVEGGTEITHQSMNIFISDLYVAGNLVMSNCRSVSFRGLVGGNTTIDAGASNIVVSGLVGGKLINRSPTATIDTNQLIAVPNGSGIMTSTLSTGTSASTDLAGQLHLNGGHATYKFGRTYSSPPICVTQDISSSKPTSITTTNQELTVSGSGEDIVNFICIGRN